jgi:hypothetical protein
MKNINEIIIQIQEQKQHHNRPKPSEKLISVGKSPGEDTRKYLVDICAKLVDEDVFGRSGLSIYFAILLKEALRSLGYAAEVQLGEATYSNHKYSYTWDHSWVIYDDIIVDANIDACLEAPSFPAGIEPRPYWGPIRMCPADRIFKLTKILKYRDYSELDEIRLDNWSYKLKLELEKMVKSAEDAEAGESES